MRKYSKTFWIKSILSEENSHYLKKFQNKNWKIKRDLKLMLGHKNSLDKINILENLFKAKTLIQS